MKSQPLKTKLKLLCLSIGIAISAPTYAITLQEAVEDAIIHSPQFREQLKYAQSIEADKRSAEGGYYPKIDLSAGIGYEEIKTPNIDNTGGNGLTRQEAAIRLTQNLFEGFGTQSEVARQQARLDAQKYTVEDKANQIALDMIKAYVKLVTENLLMRLAEDNRDTHQKILDQIIERQKAGIGNKVEVDQARARLYLAETNLESEKNNYYDARARFHRVLGRKVDNRLIEPKFQQKLPATLEEAINTGLQNFPVILSANADMMETYSQVKSFRKYYYPKVDLQLEKTFDRNLSGIKGPNEDLQLMLRMTYNLYNGGSDEASVNSAVASFQRAAEIRNKARRELIEELRYAWNAVEALQAQIKYQNFHIKMTHDTLIGYRKQFSLGRRSLLDLLNTEDEYNTAMRNIVNSKKDLLIAKYRVLHGMGKLLPAFNIDLGVLKVDESYDDL
jgi:adhesin transport system outer membrane protein